MANEDVAMASTHQIGGGLIIIIFYNGSKEAKFRERWDDDDGCIMSIAHRLIAPARDHHHSCCSQEKDRTLKTMGF